MPRTPQHQARATKLAELVPDIRKARKDLRDEMKKLPAPALRNAAQKRDAAIIRAVAVLVQVVLILVGVAGTDPADLETTEA